MVVGSMGARACLEAQRLLLAQKLQALGSQEAPPIFLDEDRASTTSSVSLPPPLLAPSPPTDAGTQLQSYYFHFDIL